MRLTAFFKLYKMCVLLHRCNLKILAKNRFEKSAIVVKSKQILQNPANFAKILPILKKFNYIMIILQILKNAAKRVLSCKDRCRYSRRRAKFCRNVAKLWQLPYGSYSPRGRPASGSASSASSCFGASGSGGGSSASESGFRVSKISKFCKILQIFANFWRARSRLYQNEILQENMCLTAFFKLYKMCTLLHRSKLNILAKIGLRTQQFS